MLNVFIVEDEPLIRNALRKMLTEFEADYNLQYCGEAADGEIALSMIQEIKPDILLTDIRMPFMDGLTLSKFAKELLPWLHVVIITGFEEFAYTKEAISIGVEGYITKPIQKAELAEVFEKIQIRRQQTFQKERDPNQQELLLNQEFYKEHFLSKLQSSSYLAGEIYEREKRLKIRFLGQSCGILTGFLRPAVPDKNTYHELLSRLTDLFDNDQQVLITTYDNFQLKSLITAADQQQVLNKTYYVADILAYELKKMGISDYNLYIGPQTSRVSEIGNLLNWTQEQLLNVAFDKHHPIIEMAPPLSEEDYWHVQEDYLLLLQQTPLPTAAILEKAQADCEQLENVRDKKKYRFKFLELLLNKLEQVNDGNFRSLLAEYPEKQLLTIAETDSLTALTARLFLEELQRTPDGIVKPTMTRGEYVIHQAIAYMKEHFADPDLSLQTMSDQLNISTAYLSTLFSQNEGVTFIEYLTKLRMEKAKFLLATTTKKIIDITFEVGYNDPNYFSFIFKKRHQVTPKIYRNQMQQLETF